MHVDSYQFLAGARHALLSVIAARAKWWSRVPEMERWEGWSGRATQERDEYVTIAATSEWANADRTTPSSTDGFNICHFACTATTAGVRHLCKVANLASSCRLGGSNSYRKRRRWRTDGSRVVTAHCIAICITGDGYNYDSISIRFRFRFDFHSTAIRLLMKSH